MIYLCYEIQEKRNLAGGSICLWENCDDFPGQNQGSVSGVSVHSRSSLSACDDSETHYLISEAPMLGLGHFVDDYLLDFDIYHVSHVTELLLYIDTKYLSAELGRSPTIPLPHSCLLLSV